MPVQIEEARCLKVNPLQIGGGGGTERGKKTERQAGKKNVRRIEFVL
jgi:hypothetical protein